jgi:hypothetical protein
VVASQLRANIADLVTQALEGGFAYRTEHWTYAGNDEREAVFARLDHLSGNEIVIEVTPVGNDPTDNRLRILSFDRDTRSAEQRDARMAAITQQLRAYDLPVGDARESGEPDPYSLPADVRPSRFPAESIDLRDRSAPRPGPGYGSGG